ncbi:MAG: hypothetical protein KY439_04770 [Actinobacteria bacterium]|nr:hypothetical protein [Actinomycetota bacterium]
MGPIDAGAGSAPEPPPGRPHLPAPDIFVIPPRGPLPVSRGAPERRLDRVNRYDRRAQLVAYEKLTTTGTIRLSFQVIDDLPFEFLPGYFVGVQADLSGRRCQSPYCIVSPPEAAPSFQLLVRLVPEGPLSCYLANLSVGDVISFRGPSGKSMIPKEVGTELVLLATGVGIGPFLALSDHLLAQGFDRPMRLYWGLRQVEDLCLSEELDDLARRHGNFSYQISLSQPPSRWTGLRGRLTESVPPLLETLGGKHFYLVGNGAMIEEMRLALSDLGVDDQLVHQETFFNVKHRPDPRVVAEIRSRFVACDLFSPFSHQEAGLFIPKRTASRRKQ